MKGWSTWKALFWPVLLGLLLCVGSGLGLGVQQTATTPSKVLVAGASGRTGALVFETLLKDSRFEPKALVRSERSAKKLIKAVPETGLDQIVVCDITSLQEESTNGTMTVPGIDGSQKLVVCSSSVPKISKISLLKALFKLPWNLVRGKKLVDFRTLRFGWKRGQSPEQVDYHGQVALIDLAKQHNMQQVVVIGSMGGTDEDNFLNSVGKKPDGTGGDILVWKRRAERYLAEKSDLDSVIIHPGGLTDNASGEERYVLDVDDELLKRKKHSISRSGVADMCVAALVKGTGKKVALDCITEPRAEDDATDAPSAEEALEAFLKEGKVYDYSR